MNLICTQKNLQILTMEAAMTNVFSLLLNHLYCHHFHLVLKVQILLMSNNDALIERTNLNDAVKKTPTRSCSDVLFPLWFELLLIVNHWKSNLLFTIVAQLPYFRFDAMTCDVFCSCLHQIYWPFHLYSNFIIHSRGLWILWHQFLFCILISSILFDCGGIWAHKCCHLLDFTNLFTFFVQSFGYFLLIVCLADFNNFQLSLFLFFLLKLIEFWRDISKHI